MKLRSIAVGTPTVPIGSYTQTVLARLPASERRALLANIADRETDVTGIVGKLTEHAIDAGFVYATDAKTVKGEVSLVGIPNSAQPQVAYGIAVVKGSPHAAQARRFISGLLSGAGRNDLLAAGFLPPPAG